MASEVSQEDKSMLILHGMSTKLLMLASRVHSDPLGSEKRGATLFGDIAEGREEED